MAITKTKTSAKRRARRTAPQTRRRPRRRPEKLPGWQALSAKERRSGYLEQVSTVRFAGLILLLAAAFTLYVGHVHATQDLFAEVQQARAENQRLHLKLTRLRGEFDRATGPSVIYKKAGALGLEEGVAYGPTIHMRTQTSQDKE